MDTSLNARSLSVVKCKCLVNGVQNGFQSLLREGSKTVGPRVAFELTIWTWEGSMLCACAVLTSASTFSCVLEI